MKTSRSVSPVTAGLVVVIVALLGVVGWQVLVRPHSTSGSAVPPSQSAGAGVGVEFDSVFTTSEFSQRGQLMRTSPSGKMVPLSTSAPGGNLVAQGGGVYAPAGRTEWVLGCGFAQLVTEFDGPTSFADNCQPLGFAHTTGGAAASAMNSFGALMAGHKWALSSLPPGEPLSDEELASLPGQEPITYVGYIVWRDDPDFVSVSFINDASTGDAGAQMDIQWKTDHWVAEVPNWEAGGYGPDPKTALKLVHF